MLLVLIKFFFSVWFSGSPLSLDFFSSWLTFFERFCTLTWDKDPWASALGSDSFPGSQCFSEVGQCIVGHRHTYETTQTCICAHARTRMHTHEHIFSCNQESLSLKALISLRMVSLHSKFSVAPHCPTLRDEYRHEPDTQVWWGSLRLMPRALYSLAKHSTPELSPQPSKCVLISQ